MQITYWILLMKKTLIQKRCIEGVSCYDFPSFFCYCYKYLIEILVRQRAFNIIEKTKTILSFSQVRKVLIYILADYLIRLKYVCYKVIRLSWYSKGSDENNEKSVEKITPEPSLPSAKLGSGWVFFAWHKIFLASYWLILFQLGGAHLEHLHREGGGWPGGGTRGAATRLSVSKLYPGYLAFLSLTSLLKISFQGRALITEFQQQKFRHFFYHVLDLNNDHVISQEDFDGIYIIRLNGSLIL